MRTRGRSPLILAAFIAALSAASCLPGGRADKGIPGAEEARAAYRSVLRERAAPRKAQTDDPLQKLLKSLVEFFQRMAEWISHNKIAVFIALGAAALCIVVVALVRRRRGRGRRRGVPGRAGKGSGGPEPIAEAEASLDGILSAAEAAAATGDYSGAVIFAHRATVRHLEERGIIARGRSYGNAEISAILGKRGAGRAEFSLAAREAERAAFGKRALSEPEWSGARRAAHALMEAVR